MEMPLRLIKLFWWVLLVFVLRGRVADLLLAQDKLAEWEHMFTPFSLLLFGTGLIALGAYSFSAYLILYFGRGRWNSVTKVSAILIGVVVCIGLRAFLEEGVLVWLTGRGNYNPETSWSFYFLDNLYYAIIFSSIGIVYYFSEAAAFNQSVAARAIQVQQEAELKFLRSQLNPHFLFNTLNNVYSLVSESSPLALGALDRLSKLLRYALYEGGKTVLLNDEIDYLRDFIHLERMRTENVAPVDFRIGPFQQDWYLPAMLLIPFVENAFKHGELRDPNQPLTIHIRETERGVLDFKVANRIKSSHSNKDNVGGIGVNNVIKRLALLYPDEHELITTVDGNTYVAELRLRANRPRHLEVRETVEQIPMS